MGELAQLFCSPCLYLRPRTDSTCHLSLPRGTGRWWQASLNKDLYPAAATEAQLSAAASSTHGGAGGSRTACAPRPCTAGTQRPEQHCCSGAGQALPTRGDGDFSKPTMESCSRSSSRVRLVLWSQEYFLLMESCRLRRYVSDSRASLKN